MNLTRKDIEDLKEEIEFSKNERPKILEELKEARAQGDLSENFEYHCAKRKNNQNNSRIRYLEKLIDTANIIEDNVWIAPNASIRGFVHLGEGCLVGMGAVVVKDVPAGETWIGNPARKMEHIKQI